VLLCASVFAQTGAPAEKLIWSEEFSTPGLPDAATWSYDTGAGGFGNQELEHYCAAGSSEKPCDAKRANAFIRKDGLLHVVARKTADGGYTSARLKTLGLKSFQHGRIEARIRIPAGQGMWPAFWMLGDDIQKVRWPACGELDIMENIGKKPDTIHGSIHGPGFVGTSIGLPYRLANGKAFAKAFHSYGMIWSPGKIQYYVDDPAKPYATFTPRDLPANATWPFDDRKFFLILNLAVGGDWPGNPDARTKFPAEMLVDYVRVWQLTDSPTP
jgi:beta-glucanase (GH16 family)